MTYINHIYIYICKTYITSIFRHIYVYIYIYNEIITIKSCKGLKDLRERLGTAMKSSIPESELCAM